MVPIEGTELSPLTPQESERREALLKRLDGGLDEAAEALNLLCEERLYRNTHTTFAAFCKDLRRMKGWGREVKRRMVSEAWKQNPEQSARQVAAVTGVSDPTASKVRREMEENGELLKFSSSVGADGKRRRRHPSIKERAKKRAGSEELYARLKAAGVADNVIIKLHEIEPQNRRWLDELDGPDLRLAVNDLLKDKVSPIIRKNRATGPYCFPNPGEPVRGKTLNLWMALDPEFTARQVCDYYFLPDEFCAFAREMILTKAVHWGCSIGTLIDALGFE